MVKTVEQRERLMAFFTALHGWTRDVGTEEMGFYSAAKQHDRQVLGIGQVEIGEGAMVTYFSTNDIDAVAKLATDLGGHVFMPPTKVMEAGSIALVMDPTGEVHGLWQARTHTGFGLDHEPGSPG